MNSKQRGSAQIVIMLIIAAVVATVVGGLIYERSRLMKENKQLNTDLVVSNEARDTAVDANKSLSKDLETERELNRISGVQAQQHQKEVNALQKKVDDLTKKLPKPVPKTSEPVQDAASADRNYRRIVTVWEVFCLSNPDPICQPKEVK